LKVLVADRIDPAAIARLREAGHEPVERNGLAGPALSEALSDASALIVRGATKVTAESLRGADALRVIVRAGTGLDNIDVEAARAKGIKVSNTPGANAVSVAELVFGLLLALERHLGDASADLRRGTWEKTRYMGRELAGRRLGLIGFGRIGREVAVRAHAFGMSVIWCDPQVPQPPSGFEWTRRVSLDELLPDSDVVSVHVPLEDGTRGLIGPAALAVMKPDALLVNCARGGIVDERALEAALRRGSPRGAALDVFETEPPGLQPLLALPNLIATPHLGASTHEAQARAGLEAADIVNATLAAR